MAERLGNLGYLGLVKEVTKGVPLVPTDWVPMYKETMDTALNLVEDNPIVGNKYQTYQVVPGARAHKGDIEVMAEGNTMARLFDSFLTKGSTTGANPYTQPYTLSTLTNPNSYTMDLSTGNVVTRYVGVEISKFEPTWDKEEMRAKFMASALGSLQSRMISSVSGAGPYTVNLDTTYDPAPAKYFVVGDLIRFYHTPTTTIDAVVATVDASGLFITTTTNVATMVAGDTVYLRPSTPAYTILAPFNWTKLQFCFGATAAAALSATQTRLEKGTTWTIEHKFESDKGADRSGAADPAALVRTQGYATFKIKRFFDTPDDQQQWMNIAKNACVIRAYAGATNQYELRITLNNLRPKTSPVPNNDSAKILYTDMEYDVVWDATDGQAFDVKIINALAII